MADKKQAKEPPKAGVKFQEQTTLQQGLLGTQSVPSITYKDVREQRELAQRSFNRVNSSFKMFTAQDPDCVRKDTAISLKHLLEQLKETMQILNIGTFQDKIQNYYLLYNATIYVFDICRILRKSVYQSLAIEYLAFCITSMEGNLQLMSIKYLDWRIKLYIELSHIYYSLGSCPVALRTIEVALSKVQELRDVEEVDPPLPDYIDKSLSQNTRSLRLLEIKFRLQSGLPPDQWKKKLEDYFGKDPEGRCIAIIESLRLQPPSMSNTIKQTAQSTPISWKEQILISAYDILRPDIERITLGLEQMMEKISQTVEFKQSLSESYQSGEEDEKKRQELTRRRREFEATLIREKEWKKSSLAIPLEYQVELAHHAYDCGNTKIFEEVSESALKRCKYRRLEVPYIVDIDLRVWTTPYPNIPNGYEKIQVDINEANLRSELKKLRNRAKNDSSEPKKEETKDKKDDKKKPVAVVQTQPLIDQVGMGVQATEAELQKINHNYVFLIYKTSMLPDNAVYDIDIVMADENDGPTDQLNAGYRAIAIPIKQYTGVRETNKTIPYLIVKHTQSGLQEEQQKLSLLTDLRPLFGKNPIMRPDFGFAKIMCDLRQTPKEFIRSPNMDYVYLTYKIDRFFHINEREIQILLHFHALEKSYQREKAVSLDDDARLELDICYDIESLHRLIGMLGSCLEGHLGESFLQERKDFLAQLVFQLWRKYFVSQLYQIDFIQQLLITRELSTIDYERYSKWIEQAKSIFKEGLLVFNQILFKIHTDSMLLCKVNLSLSKLLEQEKEFKIAAHNLRQCLIKIEVYRNERLARGVESQKDQFLPFSLTCSNQKIKAMVKKMKETYITTKNNINREIRIKQRQVGSKTLLDADEENEEEFEVLEIYHNYLNDDNRDSQYFTELDKQVDGLPIDNTNLIINALHADLLINIYRCELKAGGDTQKTQIQINQFEGVQGLATSVMKKMTISKGPTAQTIKKNLTQLQSTLQKEGKIEPPKPHIHDYEKELMGEANKNNYANCLYYMVLATNKVKQSEQKSLLQKSIEYLKEADKEEEMHINNGIRDSIFVVSTLLDNCDTQVNAEQHFPFKMIYHPDYIRISQVPRKPILISRGSNYATFKLPPFRPEQLVNVGNTDQAKKVILSMAIFGKISANGVNVSLTCNDLPNTGTRQKIGGVVHITQLKQNAKYCFAVAGYDGNEAISNSIGETGDDICMLHPLPLPLLASYLAKTSYQLSHFEVAEEASDMCIACFTEDSGFLDKMLDNAQNPLYIKRLVQERLREVGLLEISNLTETLLIKAKCMKRKLLMDQDDSKSTPAYWQKQCLKVCNYLLLALETCLCARTYTVAKRLVGEMYNMIDRFLGLAVKPLQVFHVLLKAQMVVVEIPKQYWDANLRILSGKLTYEILKMSLQMNELNLGKRVIYAEIQAFNRKWYQVPKLIMVEEQQQSLSQAPGKGGKDPKKDIKKPIEVEQQVVKMIPKLVRELYETSSSVQDQLEETLLAMHEEYGEYVSQFVDRWRESIDTLIPYVENPTEQLDRAFSDLSLRLEYWDYFKDIGTAFQKVQVTFKASPIYTEVLCKLFRRMLEAGVDPKIIHENIQTVGEIAFTDSVKLANDIRDLQLATISKDIEFYPPSLKYLMEERETNKQGNDDAIHMFQQYNEKRDQLNKLMAEENYPEYGIGSLLLQAQRFDRINLWQSEYNGIKSIVSYQIYKKEYKVIKEVQPDQYCSVYALDLYKMKSLVQEYEAHQEVREASKKHKLHQQQQLLLQQQQAAVTSKGAKQVAPVQPKELLSEEDSFKNTIEQVFKYISLACCHALQAKEYTILINELKYLLNVLTYEQVSPFQHKGNDSWKYLALCGTVINQMLNDVKLNGLYQRRKEREESFFVQPHLQTKSVVRIQEPNRQPEPTLPVLSTHLSKEFWFSSIPELEMDLIANVQAYIVQCLMVEEKYKVLIGISREFCNVTTHFYSIYMLPFTVNAQQILLSEAKPLRQAKEQELFDRAAAFETWVLTKKKKTRSAQLTNEVAPEETEFLHDKVDFEHQIALLKQKELFIQVQLDHSEKLIGEIQRDANQALEGLKQVRKLYEKFAVDDRPLFIESFLSEFTVEQQNIKKIALSLQVNDNSLKQRRKNHKQLAMQIISRYKLTIEVLRKRQEKFALVLALKEIGNLNYAISNLPHAEEMWSDALDTIFQRIYTLKNSTYRKILNESTQPLAQTYGITQCLIGLNLCSTLTYFSYQANIHQQREAQLLASELVLSVFKMNLPNSMTWATFVQNGTCELGDVALQLFNDRFILNPAETAISCERMSWLLIDRDDSLKSLPMLAFLKQLGHKLGSHFYTVRAMLMQSLALSSLGCINESYQLLVKVAGEKDLPLPVGSRPSEWQSKTTGGNWFGGATWQNSIPPYDEKHFAMTTQILKDLQLSRAFGIRYGLLNENLFNYALAQLIYNIHGGDIVEKWEINEQRTKVLYSIDKLIRATLKKVSFDEELDFQVYLARNEEQFLRISGEDQQANELQIKRKEEIFINSKTKFTDPAEFEDQYNLLSNRSLVGLSNNEENLPYFEKRSERLHMMARLRSLLSKVNLSVGLVSRAMFIQKQAIENVSLYCFESRVIETGDEPENTIALELLKPQGIEGDNKKGGKPAAVVKEDKKQAKGGKPVDNKDEEEKKREEEKRKKLHIQMTETIALIVETRRTKRCINVFWWIKLRVELLQILYRQNRLVECLEYIEQLKIDVKTFNDPYYSRIITEYSARILVKQGKHDDAVKKFDEALAIAKQYNQNDSNLTLLQGDYAELLRERSQFEEAQQLFFEAFNIVDDNLVQMNYGFGVLENQNTKAAAEGIQICTDLQIPREAEEEILRKTDRLNNIKPGKKDDKKNQQESKSNKKGPNIGQQKGNLSQPEKPQMKVSQLNPLPTSNLKETVKLHYIPLDLEVVNFQNNCYLKFIEVWLRCALRHIESSLMVNPVAEDSAPPQDDQSSEQSSSDASSQKSENQSQSMLTVGSKKNIFNEDEMMDLLTKIECVIKNSYSVPISFELELYLLQAKIYRRRFTRILLTFQNEYFRKYLKEKVHKYKKFWEKRPYRDLVRNNYFLEIPGFCQDIKETGLGYLHQAKETLKNAITVIRGESILFEHFRKPEDVLFEMAEICLMIREYRPRIGYKHIKDQDLQNMVNAKQGDDTQNMEQQLEKLEKSDKLEQLNSELEANSYLKYSIELVKARSQLCEQYHSVGQANLPDVSKLPLDIFVEILEQDYIYKKDYPSMLFEENKKKVGVNAIDILVFMQKAWREARIMTFSGNYLQRYLSKAHRFLKMAIPTSYQKCILNSIDVAPKAEVNTVFIEDGSIVIRNIYDRLKHEFKFIYILGGLNKDSITMSITKEERDKILINDERDVLYGNIQISEGNLSILLQEAFDLKSKMQESDIKQVKAKERDYKNHKKAFYHLIESIGTYFFQRSTVNDKFGEGDGKKKKEQNFEMEQVEIDLLDKYGAFVPELTHDNVDLIINLFNEVGVQERNNNYLVILRYFHKNKYK